MAIYTDANDLLTSTIEDLAGNDKIKEVLVRYLGANWLRLSLQDTPTASLNLLVGEALPNEVVYELMACQEEGKPSAPACLADVDKASIHEKAESLRKRHDPIGKFYADHDEIDSSCEETLSVLTSADNSLPEVKETDIYRLQTSLTRFFSLLEEHFSLEEEKLFPAIGAHIGFEGGPLAVMLYEHKLILSRAGFLRNLLAELVRDTSKSYLGLATFRLHFVAFSVFLRSHAGKEDAILFPMADEMLSAEEKSLLAKEISSSADAG